MNLINFKANVFSDRFCVVVLEIEKGEQKALYADWTPAVSGLREVSE